ncbi:hypothetical protein HDU67_004730, partial [Dinochytrium kinnereticum]
MNVLARLGPKRSDEDVFKRLGPPTVSVLERLGAREGRGRTRPDVLEDELEAYMRGEVGIVEPGAGGGVGGGWGQDWDAPPDEVYRRSDGGVGGRAVLNYDDLGDVVHGE